MNSFGIATYKQGKLYFDDNGWKIIGDLAKKLHTSRRKLVIDALKRYIKLQSLKSK